MWNNFLGHIDSAVRWPPNRTTWNAAVCTVQGKSTWHFIWWWTCSREFELVFGQTGQRQVPFAGNSSWCMCSVLEGRRIYKRLALENLLYQAWNMASNCNDDAGAHKKRWLYSIQSQCPTGRVFQYRVNWVVTGIERNTGCRVGFGYLLGTVQSPLEINHYSCSILINTHI